MMFLIYSLLTIFCTWNPSRAELRIVRIINCVDENGDLVDSKLITSMSRYSLYFVTSGTYWQLSVYLDFNSASHTLEIKESSSKLVKCTEEIIISNCDTGCLINVSNDKYITTRQFFPRSKFKGEWYTANTEARIEFSLNNQPTCKGYSKTYKSKDLSTKSKYGMEISRVKSMLGISRNKIKTASFKVILTFVTRDRNTQAVRKTTVETIPFYFSENEDGTVVLCTSTEHKCLYSFYGP
ncbi:hypothetical protein CDIK_4166 [Cucumispora dikerogammari]|nr:hypothetical protein CDIK_4166 [Cucumispora dikerogammari]